MGGRSHALTPYSASLGEGGAALSPQGLCTPLSFCQSEVCSRLLCEEELGAGPEAWGMQGSTEEKGPSAWENTHPHARTCFHSECALDLWDKFPGGQATGSPAPAGTVACGRRGLPRRPCFTDLCHGGTHASPGRRGAAWEGGWFPRCFPEPPCVILWPRVTVHEHTTSRVSTGSGGGERGGGRRHEGI